MGGVRLDSDGGHNVEDHLNSDDFSDSLSDSSVTAVFGGLHIGAKGAQDATDSVASDDSRVVASSEGLYVGAEGGKRKGKHRTMTDAAKQTDGEVQAVENKSGGANGEITGPEKTEVKLDIYYNECSGDERIYCNGGDYWGLYFDACSLDDVRFDNCKMINVSFRGCMLADVLFTNVFLRDVEFSNCTYHEYTLSNDKLEDIKVKEQECEAVSQNKYGVPEEIADPNWFQKPKDKEQAAIEGAKEQKARDAAYAATAGATFTDEGLGQESYGRLPTWHTKDCGNRLHDSTLECPKPIYNELGYEQYQPSNTDTPFSTRPRRVQAHSAQSATRVSSPNSAQTQNAALSSKQAE